MARLPYPLQTRSWQGAVRYPALDLGQSDSRNLADACGHGWDRLGVHTDPCGHAGHDGRRNVHPFVCDVRPPQERGDCRHPEAPWGTQRGLAFTRFVNKIDPSPSGPLASIGDENAGCAPASLNWE
jgi:hypothetical protein